MFRAIALAAPLVLASLSLSLPSPARAHAAQAASDQQCPTSGAQRQRGRGIGSTIGGMAGMFGGRAGSVAGMATRMLPVGELLGEAIANLLDRCEQQKAAAATEDAVRGGVGTTTTWTSDTRPGVTGSSVVTAQEQTADGDCMTVTDIVIVDGEETRAPKRMCRRPPSTRYVRV